MDTDRVLRAALRHAAESAAQPGRLLWANPAGWGRLAGDTLVVMNREQRTTYRVVGVDLASQLR